MRGLTRRTAVLDLVGLTPGLVGEHTPFLRDWLAQAEVSALRPCLPAVTCSVQTSMLTGVPPARHGVVANGWYDRDAAELRFWRQSNRLVQAPKLWERAREIAPGFTCANLFWWFAMYSSTDVTVTPRPMYPADGRKIPDVWTHPPELRHTLQNELGRFPLFEFWGPRTSINSSRWIAEAAKRVEAQHSPDLSLVYVPHLDYVLQREGLDGASVGRDLAELDALCADLIGYLEGRGVQVVALSEYAIAPVSRPVHPNRVLRRAGLLAVRDELGRELMDAGASAAFAMADHQVAHIYVQDPARLDEARAVLQAEPGVAEVLDRAGQAARGLDHPRSGDLVAVAEPGAWFTYYYWLDDARAPDFARTVDIHRKPGYDPVELFIDPAIRLPRLKLASVLARKAMGFRTLMDVIPLDATLVRGSHGLAPHPDEPGSGEAGRDGAPLVATRARGLLPGAEIEAHEVHDLILAHLFGPQVAQREALLRAAQHATGDAAGSDTRDAATPAVT